MANLSIAVLNGRGESQCRGEGENELVMVWQGRYRPGDRLVFTTDEVPGFYVIRVDGAMEEAYVYLTRERVEYTVPFDPENPLNAERISYHPGSFTGERHYIAMRKARAQENGNYRNLAKNVMDQYEDAGCYPHAHANVATSGPIAPLFAARNAVDGLLASAVHYPWPYTSWGIDRREDAEITVEFGRPVDMEELRLTTRADFPHDSWWVRGTVSFSDGTSEVVELGKKAEPQPFLMRKKGITWLKVGQLIKADDPSPFPALTQIEVFGRNSQR